VRQYGDNVVVAIGLVVAALLYYALLSEEQPVNPVFAEYSQFGYDPDPEGALEFAKSLPNPTFAEAGADLIERTEPQDTFLYRAMDAAHRARYNSPWKVSNQGSVGSCVAHGAVHALYASESVSWAIGERNEPPELAHQPSLYGGSRVEIRNKQENRGGDGSTGYHAAQWLKEYGVIYQREYDSFDCRDNSPALCKLWGRYGNGGKGNTELDNDAKEHPAAHVTRVDNWEELVAAICNGYAVTIASSQGFERTAVDGWCRPRGSWMHQMAIIGVKVSGDRQGACIANSWGEGWLSYTGKTWPDDLPKGCFWADRQVVERILSQQDSWAIADVAFHYRDIHHNNWLEQK